MNEFDIIRKYFVPLTQGHDDLKNDAATLQVLPGFDLIVTSDTSNAGTHFMADATPENIAHKALRRNLSDLAAMGAKPLAYQLNIAFPEKPQKEWLLAFTKVLLADQEQFGIYCSGGDTTSINGPLSISITALGFVPTGKALHRKGAQPGDHIILMGPVGDALIGLRVLRKEIKTGHDDYFINAYYKPMPRTAIVEILREHAAAAIDISDGLVADLGHITEASGCGAKITLTPGLFSANAVKTQIPAADLLTGGDDYELLLAVRPEKSASLIKTLTAQGLKPLKIGEFTSGQGVSVMDEKGVAIPLKNSGWTHF